MQHFSFILDGEFSGCLVIYDIVTMLSQLLAWQLPKNDFWFLGQISQDSRVTAMPRFNIAGEIYCEFCYKRHWILTPFWILGQNVKGRQVWSFMLCVLPLLEIVLSAFVEWF